MSATLKTGTPISIATVRTHTRSSAWKAEQPARQVPTDMFVYRFFVHIESTLPHWAWSYREQPRDCAGTRTFTDTFIGACGAVKASKTACLHFSWPPCAFSPWCMGACFTSLRATQQISLSQMGLTTRLPRYVSLYGNSALSMTSCRSAVVRSTSKAD